MRIGIDATSWMNGRGYGRFTRELLRAIMGAPRAHQYTFFIERQNVAELVLDGKFELVPVDVDAPPTEAAKAGGSRSLADMWRFTRAVSRAAPDVMFFPTVYTYFPVMPFQRCVTAIHDAIAERFPELTFADPRSRRFWNMKVKLAVLQSRRIVTVSEYSRRDLEKVLAINPSRLRVVLEAAAPAFKKTVDPDRLKSLAERIGFALDVPWIIYVGGFNPHKNVDVLIRAHAALLKSGAASPQLLLVGTLSRDVFHGDQGNLRRLVEESGTAKQVFWCGFVPDDELALLHSGAVCLVLPSAVEGFGLPAIEAAQCGTCVIATRESPLPEILNGGGIFVSPGSLTELSAALTTMCTDDKQRARWAQAALERATALRWSKTAADVLDVLEDAAT